MSPERPTQLDTSARRRPEAFSLENLTGPAQIQVAGRNGAVTGDLLHVDIKPLGMNRGQSATGFTRIGGGRLRARLGAGGLSRLMDAATERCVMQASVTMTASRSWPQTLIPFRARVG